MHTCEYLPTTDFDWITLGAHHVLYNSKLFTSFHCGNSKLHVFMRTKYHREIFSLILDSRKLKGISRNYNNKGKLSF